MDIDIKVSEDRSSLSMRLDENNVDIEEEMAQMAKTPSNIICLRRKSAVTSIKSSPLLKKGDNKSWILHFS